MHKQNKLKITANNNNSHTHTAMPRNDNDVAAARDEVVIGVWTNTLPASVEQMLKAKYTATGSYYADLTCLHNQYMTALTVFDRLGITHPDAPDLSDAKKLEAIEIAKGLVKDSA